MKKNISLSKLPQNFRWALIACLLPLSAQGQRQLQWDTTSGDTVVTEGSGTWAVGVGNWWDGAADQVWADGDTAIFGGAAAGTAGTVTLGSDITTNDVEDGLDFVAPADGTYALDLNGFTLTTGGTNQAQRIRVGSGGEVEINDSVGTGSYLTTTEGNIRFATLSSTLTFNARVTDADGTGTEANGAMFITGAGGLTFNNPLNDFTGRVGKQNGGQLTLNSIANSGVPSAAGAGSEVFIAFNAQLFYNGTGDSTDRTFSFGGTSAGSIFSSGSGPLIWTGPFLNLTSGTGTRTLNFRGTNTGDNEFQGDLVDNPDIPLAITKLDAGTWIFSGDNTYTGRTLISAGVLQANAADVVGVSGAFGNGGDINFEGGTLQYTANSASTDYSARIVNSASAMIFDTNGENVTMENNFATTNTGGITKEGAGTLSVQAADSGDRALNGDKIVNGGTLSLFNDDVFNLGYSSRGNFFINNGSTLAFAAGNSDDSLPGNGRHILQNNEFTFDSTGGGTVDFTNSLMIFQNTGGANMFTTTGGATNFIQGGTATLQNTNTVVFNVADGSDTIDLQISTQVLAGNIEKDGAGTLSLTSTTNNLAGGGNFNDVTISEGTLEIGGAGRLQSGNYEGPIINDGIFQYNSTAAQTLSGLISGTGSLVKDNTGTLTVTTPNTYTGDTTLNAGTLTLGDGTNNTTLEDGSTVTVATGANLNLDYAGTDNVSALILNGVSQPAGVYDSSNAAGFITGTGTLTVSPVVASIYGIWASDNGLTAANNATTANPDSDGLVNLLEFAFGTDPLVSDGGALVSDGSVNGSPIVEFSGSGAGITFDALFVRRDDHGTSGSLNYTVEFSADLVTFEESTATPTFVADSSADSDYEVVSVPYPDLLPGSGLRPRFFRVRVDLVP